ncbi:MAG: DUF4314 domain-containing protein [Lachnospiraceae bacterium]|nr:DUF4314 domain-containing protein [Lachnospiraceae bacterium]
MKFATKEELEQLRREFPAGCRIVLDSMDDPYTKIPVGTHGTCKGVDDAGNVMASWDIGSSLSVAFGADCCHRVASETEAKETLECLGKSQHSGLRLATRCPRCGVEITEDNRLLAVSRFAHILICENCGTEEALISISGLKPMPLLEWAVLNPEKKPKSQEVTTVCYGEKKIWKTRIEALKFFWQAVQECDGSERDRYINVYTKLKLGFDVCSDGEEF